MRRPLCLSRDQPDASIKNFQTEAGAHKTRAASRVPGASFWGPGD